jgi:hypothetical protein
MTRPRRPAQTVAPAQSPLTRTGGPLASPKPAWTNNRYQARQQALPGTMTGRVPRPKPKGRT